MYRWYQRSAVCYAYLSDVVVGWEAEEEQGSPWLDWLDWVRDNEEMVKASLWWTRGWTLQEFVAPSQVHFFARGTWGWRRIGSKISLIDLISERTGIDHETLRGRSVMQCSIAMRMSWASMRATTREDVVYCLLDIFDVNMPLLYGEGAKAFQRLQEEIMKVSDDQTLFAWTDESLSRQNHVGLLAASPLQFKHSANLVPTPNLSSKIPYELTNRGLRIELPLLAKGIQSETCLGILQCVYRGQYDEQIALPLVRLSSGFGMHYARDRAMLAQIDTVRVSDLRKAKRQTILVRQKIEEKQDWANGTMIQIDLSQDNRFELLWVAPTSGLPLASGTAGQTCFLVPPSIRSGAIVFGNSKREYAIIQFETSILGDRNSSDDCSDGNHSERQGGPVCKISAGSQELPSILDLEKELIELSEGGRHTERIWALETFPE